MKKNVKGFSRVISVLLTLVMLFSCWVFSPLAPKAGAATTGLTLWEYNGLNGYSNNASTGIASGRYYINTNTTIKAKNNTEYNGGIIQQNATVLVYIPSGVTLTCEGGAGNGTTPGQGGLYLRGGATLIITGPGKLVAKGGKGGNGTDGEQGYSNSNGGYGGYGGAGGGAGIGGDGGGGGDRGDNGNNSGGNGWNGSDGGAGGNGVSGRTIYILDSITSSNLTTTNGTNGGYGNGGGVQSATDDDVGGGGGGGGRGQGGHAIGSGGPGGGGGGGGGAGDGSLWWKDQGRAGGGGKIDGKNGSTGTDGTQSKYTAGSGGASGSYADESGNHIQDKTAFTAPDYAKGLVTFDKNGGSGGTDSAYQTIGYPMQTKDTKTSGYPNITLPTKDGYDFDGYWTSVSGGTKYINADGSSAHVYDYYELDLYAHWKAKDQTVTLNKQSGSDGTSTVYYTYNTNKYYSNSDHSTQITSVTVPTRTGYTFGGYYTETNGGGTQYITAAGAFTNNLYKQYGTDSEQTTRTLYAKWTINTSTLTVKPNTGTWETYTSDQSYTQNYNTTKAISNPTPPDGKHFTGWTLGGDSNGTFSGGTYTFGAGNNKTDTLTAGFAAHTWDDGEITTQPTCTSAGVKTFHCTYTSCSATKSEVVNALNHNYGTPTYSWAADGTSCTATRTCSRNADHKETENAAITSAVLTPATCTGAGTTRYTATFSNTAFSTKTKDVQNLPALEHDWKYASATFNWNGFACPNATVSCNRNSSHTENINTNVTSEITVPPKRNTKNNDGERTYTAKFNVDGTNYTSVNPNKEYVPALDTYADLEEKTAVVDYTGTVNIDITDEMAKIAVGESNYGFEGVSLNGNDTAVYSAKTGTPNGMPHAPATSVTGSYGTLAINGKTLTYTPDKININGGYDSFWIAERIDGAEGFSASAYTYKKITIIPATSIYYEDDFQVGQEGGLIYTDSENTDAAPYGVWTTVPKNNTTTSAARTANLAGTIGSSEYGFNTSNTNFTTYSGGSAHKVSVSAATNGHKVDNTTTAETVGYPMVSFTFRGTGFDLISATSNECGIFAVKYRKHVDEGTNNYSWKTKMVDTYYGYSYGTLWYSDYSPRFVVSDSMPGGNYVPVYPTEGVTQAEAADSSVYVVSTFGTVYSKDQNDPKVPRIDGTPVGQAEGWVKSDSSSSTTMYQVPVIKIVGLDYDTYDVQIEARFTTAYGHYMTDGDTKYFDLYVDGIRVYDPLGKNVEVNSVPYDAYKVDDELYPQYTKIRDKLSANGETATGAILLDGMSKEITSTELKSIVNASPTNEVYIKAGCAVAFDIVAGDYTDIQIGMRSPKGTTSAAILYENSSVDISNIPTAEMYYSLYDRFTDVSSMSGTLVVTNTGTDVLSLTFFKTTSLTPPPETESVSPQQDSPIEVNSDTAPNAIRMLRAFRAAQTVTEPSSEVVDPTEPTSEVVDPTEPTTEVVEPTEPTTGETEITEPQGDNGSDGKTLNWLTKIIVRTIQFIRDLIARLK